MKRKNFLQNTMRLVIVEKEEAKGEVTIPQEEDVENVEVEEDVHLGEVEEKIIPIIVKNS